jgi:hypothetical protein
MNYRSKLLVVAFSLVLGCGDRTGLDWVGAPGASSARGTSSGSESSRDGGDDRDQSSPSDYDAGRAIDLHASPRCETAAPTPTPLLDDPSIQVAGISVGVDAVFVADPWAGQVWSVPKCGGAATLIVEGENYPTTIANAGGWVAWMSEGPPDEVGVVLAGGGPKRILARAGWLGLPVAMDANRVYYYGPPNVAGVYSVPLAGGPPSMLVQVDPQAYFLALDTSFVYFVRGDGAIVSVPKTGEAATPVVSDAGGAFDLVVDNQDVFWIGGADSRAATIERAPKVGGSPAVLATGQDSPQKLALDDANVYWVASKTLMRIAKTGGAPMRVTSANDGDIGVDEWSLYFVSGRALMKIDK